ncbi:MAG: tRNA pseudouridine(38-40) synthase TruA [Actinomycetota bacterium]|nr:tRNA pseudouridine(38-40) synthase TruA [Actinomycetota bacterium]
MRLRLDVAYDGSAFSGWAVQPSRRTVQGELQSALATLLRVPDVTVTCAGRTDAGVHARGQVCHVDLDGFVDPGQLRRRLAGLLPSDLRVRACGVAPDEFDARFSARWRRYVYRLCDDPAALDPLRRHEIAEWPRRLDVAAMEAAASQLRGEHDFAAFCRRREGATTVRTLLELRCRRDHPCLVTATVVADAFCHNMVRSLVGALVAVGEGRRPVDWPRRVLAGGVRDSSVRVMPPHGLTLEEVGYPAEADLAAQAQRARAVRVSSM